MKVDMSPKAIERRLNDLNEIWLLCVTLSKARRVPAKTKQLSNQNKKGLRHAKTL